MDTFLEKVRNTILREKLIVDHHSNIIIAISGGADSVALLMALRLLGYNIIAAHCNFNLRGAESKRDEDFVRELCSRENITCRVKSFDTSEYAANKKISIEIAARELRYSWFRALREELRCDYIAVAHHADDNVETLLLNLSFGTGIRGLSGMPYKRDDGIIRPLLDVSRAEIITFIESNFWEYVNDSSNAENVYRRNIIRNRIIPLLNELNPSFLAAGAKTIQNLRGAEAFFDEAIASYHNQIFQDNIINVADLLRSPSPQTLLYECLRIYGFNRTQVFNILESINNKSGGIFLADPYRLSCHRDQLILSCQSSDNNEEIFLEIEDILNTPYFESLLIPCDLSVSLRTDKNTALFDYDALQGKHLTIRTRREADRIAPFGIRGNKKVSKVYKDLHMSIDERKVQPILCVDNEPVWIIGIMAGRNYGITASTKRMLKLTVKDTFKSY